MKVPGTVCLWTTAREVILATLMLALLFLSFAHQPVFAAPNSADGQVRVASYSFCGQGQSPIDGTSHGPCHACRVSLANLPSPVCMIKPVRFEDCAFAKSAEIAVAGDVGPKRANTPRAPPKTV